MSYSNYNNYNQVKSFQEKIKGVYVCKSGDSMTGNLSMSCNEILNVENISFCNGTNYLDTIQDLSNSIPTNFDTSGNLDMSCNQILDVSGITFCDGTYIGHGSSFDISTNEVLHLKTSQNVLVDGDVTMSNNVDILGNLNVRGTTTQVSTQDLVIKDNLIIINQTMDGSGNVDPSGVLVDPTDFQSGFVVYRGPDPLALDPSAVRLPYQFLFDESSNTFQIGISGEMQPVATREDVPTDNGVAVWDASTNRFVTNRGVFIDSSGILDMSLNNITNVGDLTLRNNIGDLGNILINFNRNNETDPRAYVWYQNSGGLIPEMLRFGSGSGTTSWTISLRDLSGAINNQVNQLSYGYSEGDNTSLFAMNYSDISAFNGQQITNLFRIQSGGTNLSQLLYTKDGKFSIGNSIEDVSNNGDYRLDINGKSLFRNDVEISGNLDISENLVVLGNTLLNDVSLSNLELSGNIILNCNEIIDISNIFFCNSTNYIDTIKNLDLSVNQLEDVVDDLIIELVDLSDNKYDKSGGLINGNVEISGNLDMSCNLLNDVSGINFCDGTYIGSGSSFDISTNEVLHIKSSQNVLITPTSDISLSNTSYGLSVVNTNTKTYPTTTNFLALPVYSTNVELGTDQSYNLTTGFNFIFGDRRTYTKSAGTTSDIERLFFNGFQQSFDWTDLNTCKQYVGFRNNFIYTGINANNRTSSSFDADRIILSCPSSFQQTISNVTSEGLTIVTNNNNDVSYNITNSNSSSVRILGSGINNIINITNHSFLQNSGFWNCNLTGAGSSATITNMYGLRLHPPNAQTGLTITNNWGVYSGWSSSKNFFAGGVGIGTTTINNALDINGSATISTSLQVPQITNTGDITIDPSNALIVAGNLDVDGNVDISGNLTLNCNDISAVNSITFCDGTYLGPGNSFDISTNEVLHIKTSQNVLIDGDVSIVGDLDVNGNVVKQAVGDGNVSFSLFTDLVNSNVGYFIQPFLNEETPTNYIIVVGHDDSPSMSINQREANFGGNEVFLNCAGGKALLGDINFNNNTHIEVDDPSQNILLNATNTQLTGGIQFSSSFKTSNYTLQSGDYAVSFESELTATLPLITANNVGKEYIITNVSSGNMDITTTGGQFIFTGGPFSATTLSNPSNTTRRLLAIRRDALGGFAWTI